MMVEIELDRADLRIPEVLQKHDRLASQEVAARVSLSPSPCLRRIALDAPGANPILMA
jgi:Lrp/AsnC family transcriptional regulator, leucine-responsive regulatory protein